MPNPISRHTRSRRDSRRAQNWKLSIKGQSRCANCGETHVPHTVCSHCGFYDGKLVVPKKEKKKKKGQGEQDQKE